MHHITAIPAFADNYLWLIHHAGRRTAVAVDPGDAQAVQAVLTEQALTLTDILLTHHHADHIGGVAQLVAGSGARVWGPPRAEISGIDQPLFGGERIHIESLQLDLDVLSVPGHTRDHLAYAYPGHLFCGDTMFAGGCGRLFEGTPEQMLHSLTTLAAMPAETLIYCAHEYTQSNLRFAAAVEPGNAALQARIAHVNQLRRANLASVPSRIADERATNPFLRTDQSEVIATARRHAQGPLSMPLEVFTVLRQWKNEFR